MIAEDVSPPARQTETHWMRNGFGKRLVRRLPWAAPSAPALADFTGDTLLLASEGRAISPDALALVSRLVKPQGTTIHVLSLARIWGSRFGMPHPGLMPNKHELEVQRDLVRDAVLALRQRGYQAEGQVVSSRSPAKRIVAAAAQHGSAAIVMSADAPRHWLVADFLWSQEPYRVRRLAAIPVYLAILPEGLDRQLA